MKHSQVFLRDENFIGRVLDFLEVKEGDSFVEVGPGMGNITFGILRRGGKILAIEIDEFFCGYLKTKGVDVICGDYLNVEVEKELKLRGIPIPVRFFSSVPYHITHKILLKICFERALYSDITLILQLEVAEKLLAKPNTKKYSSFTVLMNTLFEISRIFNIPNRAFSPIPKVHSSLISLKPKPETLEINCEEFLRFLNRFFSERRKKLKNLDRNIPERFKDLRPENLTFEDWLSLFKSR